MDCCPRSMADGNSVSDHPQDCSQKGVKQLFYKHTVNTEIFARLYFHVCEVSRKLNHRKTAKSLSFTDIGKSCANREFVF